MVIGAAIAPWGSILQQAERRRRSNIFHSQEPTTAVDKVKQSVTTPIILNTLYSSSQWPYITVITWWWSMCVSVCTRAQMAGILFVHQLTGTHWHHSSNIDCLLSCMLTKWRSARRRCVCVFVLEKKEREGNKKVDKEVLIHQYNLKDTSTVGQAQSSKVSGQ